MWTPVCYATSQVTRREQGAEAESADREKGFPKDDDGCSR
jgi:hypothetical protein